MDNIDVCGTCRSHVLTLSPQSKLGGGLCTRPERYRHQPIARVDARLKVKIFCKEKKNDSYKFIFRAI